MRNNIICKLIIIVLILHLMLAFFSKVYAASEPTSLSEFVDKYGVANMSNDEIEKKRTEVLKALEGYNENIAMTISQSVGTILNQAEQQQSYDEKMKYLENEFSNQAQYLIDGDEASLNSYLYYGYMLGSTWVIYRNEQNGNNGANNDSTGNNTENNNTGNKEQTPAEKFDAKYEEYSKLTDEQKKNPLTLKEYSESLQNLYDQLPASDKTAERLEKLQEVDEAYTNNDTSALDVPEDVPIYKEPNIILGSSGSGGIDDMIGDADNFIREGSNVISIDQKQLQTFSQTLYNILLTIGIVVAVIVGSILGIKFMAASVDEKAKVKQMLVAYIIGCAVVFGSFGIWKIVVTILQNI